MRHHNGRPLQLLHDVRHRKRLSRPGYAQQGLRGQASPRALHQLPDGFRLVPGGLERRLNPESPGHESMTSMERNSRSIINYLMAKYSRHCTSRQASK